MSKLIIIRGLPGSGKSTLAATLRAAARCRGVRQPIHVEADDHFVNHVGIYKFDYTQLSEAHSRCQARTQDLLAQGNDVVVANTFTTNSEMQPYLAIAEQTNATVVVYECHNEFGSIHNVPEDVLTKMRDHWEMIEPHTARRIKALNSNQGE